MTYEIKITFRAWTCTWKDGELAGDEWLQSLLRTAYPPLEGWGPHPSAISFEAAVARRDSFLHLVEQAVPSAAITETGNPEEPPVGAIF